MGARTDWTSQDGSGQTVLPLRLPVAAVEWSCHARTTIKDAGSQVLAECSGHGRTGDESAQIAAEIVRRVNAHGDLVAAATQAARWIAHEMAEKGWPGERVANPPEGSHLFNLRAAIAKATGSAS